MALTETTGMTKEEKLEIICGEGFTEYQALTIYEEMSCCDIEDENELIDAANEWWEEQTTMERCGL